MATKASKKVMTGRFRISYPNLERPRQNDAGQDKYSAALIFTDKAALACTLIGTGEQTTLEKVALDVAIEAFGPQAAEKIRKKQIKWPFRDGEEKDYPEGSIFFNSSSNQQPGIVGPTKDPATGKARVITEIAKEVYPGATCRATLTCYSYDRPDSKGVTFGLNNVQLLDGNPETSPRLDNRAAATSEFDADDEALADIGAGEETDDDTMIQKPKARRGGKAAAKSGASLDALM